MQAKRYAEIPGMLEKPIAMSPDNYELQALRAEAFLWDGQKDRGLMEAQRIEKAISDGIILNDLAYALADTDTGLEMAQNLAAEALSQAEQKCANASLAAIEDRDLTNVNVLASTWDTRGWVYFKRGNLVQAEKYLEASWQLSQSADAADHLGQLYEKQGKRTAAIHLWRLSLAMNGKQEDATERLHQAGVSSVEPAHMGRGLSVSAGEELGKLRTIPVPALPKQTGSAEFFVLASLHGIEDVQFIGGESSLKAATHALEAAKPGFAFPDAGPEKVIRRGILSCSHYTTPSCQLTLLIPSTVRNSRAD